MNQEPREIEFSVVIACYFEEQSIDEFHERLSKTMESTGRSYEIVFTNDGSTDGTWGKLQSIFEKDPKVSTIINFYRNYGQGAAMLAGYREAQGKNIVFLDSDLQLDPEEFPKLLEEFDKDMDVVTGYRRNRQDSILRTMPSMVANAIMRKVSGKRLKDFGCTFKIIRGDLLRAFEAGPFKPWSTVHVLEHASRIAEVPVSHHPRKYGSSGYTFSKLLNTNMDNIVRLSQRPFQFLGFVCLLFAAFFVLRVLFAWTYPDASLLSEVTPGLLLNAIVIGTLIILGILSLIGEFVIRNFGVLKQDPQYIIREKITRHRPDPQATENRDGLGNE